MSKNEEMKSILKNIKNFVKSVIGIVNRIISDYTEKKYNLAIVAIAKNEQDYIKETFDLSLK